MEIKQMVLTSDRVEVAGVAEAMEVCFERGWSDGLPVVPPTEERVWEMLMYAAIEPQQIVGLFPVRRRAITAEKVAINAVMAGCPPEYFPVVLAAVEAITDAAYGLHLHSASTSGPTPLIIVNGPIRKQIGINCADSVFGPGFRANATIGRAIRLILQNCCGAIPGILDRATLGHPGRYSYCIGEHEEASPWEPLHVERGLPREASAVTVISAESHSQINSRISNDPEVILLSVLDVMTTLGGGVPHPGDGGFTIVLGPEHAETIGAAGWSKGEIRRFLFEKAQRPVIDFKRAARLPGEIAPGDAGRLLRVIEYPEDIWIVVAGGLAGRYSAVIPCGNPAVTKAIGLCGDCTP
jgi:hypothetical protein